ncbi:MAG: 6-phosphofructokinase [Bacteroidetes bacterium]|nr:6-phosphofructokinase [Bacteroidota bacterium]
MQKIERLAVFSSGGDAPGMNACIRAVVRTGLVNNLRLYGIMRGYQGMIEDEFKPLTSRSVSNIIQRGGTILKAARSKDFMTPEGMQKAYENLKQHQIDAIVAIGGDGTFKGAEAFCTKYPDIRIVGIPGTIDNDLTGTDYTLGFDTAVNNVIEAVDKIRDTAASHDRCFFIEVMGRDSGCIALWAGLAGGAEEILLPEIVTDFDELIQKLEEGKSNNKNSSIIIVGEGEKNGGADEVAHKIKELLPHYDTKVTILGHVQRGGSPTAFDRILAAKFGVWAVESLLAGENRKMIGILKGEKFFTPFSQATKQHEPLDMELLRINTILAT